MLEQWLSKQGWQTKGNPSPPRSKQQGWLVTLIIQKGQPRDITNMIFEIQGMEMPITARRWEHKRKEVAEVPLRNSKWTRPPKEESQEAENDEDKPEEGEKSDAKGDVDMTGEEKPKEESAPKRVNRKARPADNQGPDGTELFDLGGIGDCGWRSIGAAIGLAKGKTKEEI